MEIGNGYGVPGGGAYCGASVYSGKNISSLWIAFTRIFWHSFASSLERKDLDGQKTSQTNAEVSSESGQNSMAKNLPEYLKQKLRARGILKENQDTGNSLVSENVSGCSCCLQIWAWILKLWTKSCLPGSSFFNISYFLSLIKLIRSWPLIWFPEAFYFNMIYGYYYYDYFLLIFWISSIFIFPTFPSSCLKLGSELWI